MFNMISWPWNKKKEIVVKEEKELEISIPHSALDLLMDYQTQVKELLWDACVAECHHNNKKIIDRDDVEHVCNQVVAALKELIEEYDNGIF